MRARLLCFREREFVLFLTLHHISFDGWSLNILLRELGQLYRQFVAGDPAELPPLPIQFADYASWLRQWVDGVVRSFCRTAVRSLDCLR